MVGHVQILNARFELSTNTSDATFFPNLVEITDYLLVFQAQQLPSLDILFPKLAIIRGDKLFKNYALIIFLSNSLHQINLKSLVSLQRGGVLLSRLYHTCYVNTIDWAYLLKDPESPTPTMTLVKNDCFSQTCKPSCQQHNCWSEHSCQLKCAHKCAASCNLDNPVVCCQNPLCLHCYNDTSCASCLGLRDLHTGECVQHCPVNSLIYQNHSCVRPEDCTVDNPKSLIKSYHVLNSTQCVRECPRGYQSVISSLNNTWQASHCIQCPNNVCKRDCRLVAFNLRTYIDLELISDCVSVKSLRIELDHNVTQAALIDSLQYLEEIEENLVIVRNKHLNSLGFLQRLHLIHGRKLYENKFALFVHTNELLRHLWAPLNGPLQILTGTVKFFENPQLCYEDIEQFLQTAQVNQTDNSEVSFNFNGYRRLTCSNQTIELRFELLPDAILVEWNVTVSDLRRLKGFTVSYSQVNEDESSLENQGLIEWNHLYAEFNENDEASPLQNRRKLFQVKIDAAPFIKYAVYVKADLTLDSQWGGKGSYASIAKDKLISQINYIYSLPARKY